MGNLASFPAAAPAPARAAPDWGEEEQLLESIRAGDRAAAEELVDRSYAAVFASLFRMCGDQDLAADLTQETYQKAWAALPRFDGRSQIFTWLYRIAYTTFLNHVRRPRRISSLEETEDREFIDRGPAADDVLQEKEAAERLRAAVLKLPDDLRFTVTAHFWGGLTIREIAKLEEITTVAIRKRLHRAFGLLETLMYEEVPK
ncbi:MAG TPA: sigma-70 family RNA polymerase sigma factor [Thermoanaerobaculia bacterium]|nr:sigma-70 family RNA polymerase sigma factor [Thermoanaerobaculia bacterium]